MGRRLALDATRLRGHYFHPGMTPETTYKCQQYWRQRQRHLQCHLHLLRRRAESPLSRVLRNKYLWALELWAPCLTVRAPQLRTCRQRHGLARQRLTRRQRYVRAQDAMCCRVTH